MIINDILIKVLKSETLKSKICEFQTCFLPDLFYVMAKDIDNTKRPFNLDRVNTVKNSRASERQGWAHSICKRNSAATQTTSGLTHKQNGHTCWSEQNQQKGAGVNPTFTMQTTFLSANTGVYSHSYRKPKSNMMADLMTGQVHSTHAITLVAREEKRQQNNWSKTEVLGTVPWLQWYTTDKPFYG